MVYCDIFKYHSIDVFLAFEKEKISYEVITWRPPEDQEKEFHNRLYLLVEELFNER